MNKSKPPREPSPAQPLEDLYIFHLEGVLPWESRLLGAEYIGNWQEEGYCFLFFSRPSEKKVSELLASHPQLTLLDTYHMTYEQWLGEKFSTTRIGDFTIAPPWEARSAAGEPMGIVLDPGLVFGTGTHPTTRDCLRALAYIWRNESLETALDIGTGTGLLALAAARLGCRKILAVDNNPLASQTALQNVRLNGLSGRILVAQGAAEDFVDFSADLMIANIHYDILERLIGSKGFLEKKWCILSGLLRSQAETVALHLERLPVVGVRSWTDDEIWHTFCFKM